MGMTMEDEMERWTAKRKAVLVIQIIVMQGGVTTAVLPCHRTYGSVCCGSFNTLEAQPGVQQRDQT